MPRPDGKLYRFELDALKPKPEPKPKHKAKPEPKPADLEPKPKPALHPLHPEVYTAGKAGRPANVKATPELVKQICDDIRTGLPEESALIRAGITRQGIERWKKSNPVVQQAFDKAETDWEKGLVALITSKAASDHKAATWLLERRAAQRWAPVSKTELTGKNGGAMQVHSLSTQLLASVGGDMKQAVPV